MGMHAFTCTCGKGRTTLPPLITSTLFLKTRSSIDLHLNRLEDLATGSQESTCLFLSIFGIKIVCYLSFFFHLSPWEMNTDLHASHILEMSFKSLALVFTMTIIPIFLTSSLYNTPRFSLLSAELE